ncbi:hypothetical protein LINGRAHAP2_LOCUS22674 [Linum grandiflorum]
MYFSLLKILLIVLS